MSHAIASEATRTYRWVKEYNDARRKTKRSGPQPDYLSTTLWVMLILNIALVVSYFLQDVK